MVFFLSSAAIPNWPVSEIHTDCPARLAATPKLPSKLCSHYPEGLHWLKLELPSVKDFSVSRWFIFHGFVASQMRRSKTRSSHEEVPWHPILWHISCWATAACRLSWKGGCWSTRPVHLKVICLFGRVFWRLCSLKAWTPIPAPSLPLPSLRWDYQTGEDDNAALFAEDRQILMNRVGWSELLHHPSTSLRVNLPRAIWTDGYTTQINLKNTV